MYSSPSAPIQKNVVLVGAGNAHLRFVKMFGMNPLPAVAVTLVSEASVIPYSAMVPGHIAGDYTWDEITIDLMRLCRATGVRFVAARAAGIDTVNRRIQFAARAELAFDVLSLGVGSSPARPAGLIPCESSWPMRPLATLLDHLNTLEQRLRQSAAPFHLVVVGGGASGCELTLAIRKRFADSPFIRLTLLQSGTRLLPQFPARAASVFDRLMQAKGITVRCNARVIGSDKETLQLESGERLAYGAVLWATNAAPPDLIRDSGLRLNQDGFLLVSDTLQSLSDPAIFGTGDCISIDSHPELPKNGVYAVREGAILFDNVSRFLKDQTLVRFSPQRHCLCLLNTSDSSAVLTYGSFAWKGRPARWLKDHIDQIWMDQFRPRTPNAQQPEAQARKTSFLACASGWFKRVTNRVPMIVQTEEPSSMRCGGCGSKISSDVLSSVLERLDIPDDPRILLGCRAGEDAAVHRFRPELFGRDPAKLVEVQTVDYFKAFVDDPYLFGRIAALNAVSDLYAMNARPFAALAIATIPHARGPVQEAMLFELLSGAVHSFRQLGVVLTGGHTTEGSELALGFAVTGFAEDDRLFQKSKLQVGDKLILTKPLGSGALLAAWMRGECPAAWFDALIQTMLLANDRASQILAEHGVEACTDVTGFGLAGHLLEMLDASKVSAHLNAPEVQVHAGFTEMVSRGIVSSLHRDNAKAGCRVKGTMPAWLFDPQTSGGLLAAVKPGQANDVLRLLIEAGCREAALVGEVVTPADGEAPAIWIRDN
jgi:selenide,water dikinase